MIFYPVVIPTLCRFTHFKQCVESLARCKYADKTELIIGLDFPANESHKEGYDKIKSYIPLINGFAKVTVFERDKNYGAVKNILDIIYYAYHTYDAVIMTEDDNVFAPTFLEFMNSSLETFRYSSEIISISGYTQKRWYNTNVDCLYSYDLSGWGTAKWKDKEISLDIEFVKGVLFSIKTVYKIFKTYPSCLGHLCNMYMRHDWYGDTVRTIYNILNDKYQLKPAVSLVRNIGNDGSGLHCKANSNDFNKQILSDRLSYIITDSSTFQKVNPRSLFTLGLPTNRFRAALYLLKICFKYLTIRLKGLFRNS